MARRNAVNKRPLAPLPRKSAPTLANSPPNPTTRAMSGLALCPRPSLSPGQTAVVKVLNADVPGVVARVGRPTDERERGHRIADLRGQVGDPGVHQHPAPLEVVGAGVGGFDGVRHLGGRWPLAGPRRPGSASCGVPQLVNQSLPIKVLRPRFSGMRSRMPALASVSRTNRRSRSSNAPKDWRG